jgi:hypothetical protein
LVAAVRAISGSSRTCSSATSPEARGFAPGAAAAAIAGKDPDDLLAPGPGALLLAHCALAVIAAGVRAIETREIA